MPEQRSIINAIKPIYMCAPCFSAKYINKYYNTGEYYEH